MPKFKRGDVALAYLRFEEDSSQTKLRPVVIIEVYSDSCFSCMVTTNDRSGTKKGFWVEKDSEDAKKMGLDFSSFINAERTETIENIMFLDKPAIGKCPFIDELEDMID